MPEGRKRPKMRESPYKFPYSRSIWLLQVIDQPGLNVAEELSVTQEVAGSSPVGPASFQARNPTQAASTFQSRVHWLRLPSYLPGLRAPFVPGLPG